MTSPVASPVFIGIDIGGTKVLAGEVDHDGLGGAGPLVDRDEEAVGARDPGRAGGTVAGLGVHRG